MYFLDKSGHIFYEQQYKEYPIGTEYNEHEHIFWMTINDQYNLSVNNYYGQVINVLVPLDTYKYWFMNGINTNVPVSSYEENPIPTKNDKERKWYFNGVEICDYDNDNENLAPIAVDISTLDNLEVEITCESNIFHLIPAYKFENIQELEFDRLDLTNEIHDGKQILSSANDNDELGKYDILSILIHDENVDNVNKYFALIPIYVFSYSTEPASWITNIIIHIKNNDAEEWGSISVGAKYVEENEILNINLNNLGIKLPKDILHAIYDTPYNNEVFDENVWNKKLKEYLMNYMEIHVENGNFNSAIKSLKWFGYGDKITISKLFKTDNDLKTQYVRDYFDLSNDLLSSYDNFKQKAVISLNMIANEELKDEDGKFVKVKQDFSDDFYGEEKPVMIDLFKSFRTKDVGIGKTEKWKYIAPFYKYSFNEMALKIACLKDYYQEEFLPLHMSVNSASLQYKTYMDDIKYTCYPSIYINESNVSIMDNDFDVQLKSEGIYWFNEQIHKVDRFLNEYCTSLTNTMENSEKDIVLYIHDTCTNIPIKFNTPNKIYNCVFILEEVNNINEFELFCNIPITINSSIKLISNNTIYNQTYYVSYKTNDDEQWSEWFESIYDIYDIFEKKRNEENLDPEYKQEFYFKFLLHDMSVDEIVIYDNAYLKELINKDYIYNITNDIENNYILRLDKKYFTDDISYDYIYNDKVIYESKFSFINNDKCSTYKNFVIYPRLLNNNNSSLDYWIDHKFRLRMNVNDRWYEHEFICKIDELDIKYGTLKYKYWSNNEHWYSDFKQFKYIHGINGKDKNDENSLPEYMFNSFMYEPELVTINNSNFIHDLLEYYKLQNQQYIDGKLIPFNEFFYKMNVSAYGNTYTINIHNDMIGKPIYVVLDLQNKTIYEYREETEYGFDITFILSESGINNEETYEYHTGHVYINENSNNKTNEYLIFDSKNDDFFDKYGFVLFIWDESTHMYKTGIPEDNEGTGMIYIPVKQTYNTLNRNYIFNNITKQNITFPDNYLNSVFVFDLYEENKEKINIWNFNHNINTSVKGILLSNDNEDSNVFNFKFTKSIRQQYNEDQYSQSLKEQFLKQYERDTEIVINDETEVNSITTRELELLSIWWNDFRDVNIDDDINNIENKINLGFNIKHKTKYVLYEYDNVLYNKKTKNVLSLNESIDKLELFEIKFESNNDNFIFDITPSNNDLNNAITFVNGVINIDQTILATKILLLAKEHNVAILQDETDPNNLMKLYYIHTGNNGEDITSDIKVKFLYKERSLKNDKYIYEKDKVFSFTEYMNIQKEIYSGKIKIYAQLFYTVNYKQYGIKHEFNGINSNAIFNFLTTNNENFHNHIFKYNNDKHNFEIIDDTELSNNKIAYNEIRNKFGDIVDDRNVKQHYWLETKPTISSINNNEFVTTDQITNITDFSDLYINWNDNTDLNTIDSILNKCLSSINSETYETQQRPIIKDYYEYLINQYYYENIFAIDLTHIPGKYEIEFYEIGHNESCIKLCAVIIHEDDTISIYNQSNDTFTVLESDKMVKVFIQCEICPTNDINNDSYWNKISKLMNENGVNMILRLYKYYDQKYSKVKYDTGAFKNDSSNTIELKFNDSVYYIDNNQDGINDLYLRFFTNYNSEELPKLLSQAGIELSHFYKQNVEITDMFLKYDVYLMHDFNYWYAIFISQDTIDKIDTRERLYVKSYRDIYVPKINEDDPEILLKFVKHGTVPLINRLYCEYNTNNVFNKNDIIVANIQNNKKLSINPVISSKWNITNISIGSPVNSKFESNNEMCIITTGNDTIHQPGYYNVNVHYTLNNLTNNQFKAESRFKVLK